jgi:hypothetical protein
MTPEEFESIHWPEEPKPVFYRAYYDPTNGQVLFYSMDDEPGTYIQIDQNMYTRSPSQARVKNGQLIEYSTQVLEKLVPSNTGFKCHPNNVAVIVEQEPYLQWSKKVYETY